MELPTFEKLKSPGEKFARLPNFSRQSWDAPQAHTEFALHPVLWYYINAKVRAL